MSNEQDVKKAENLEQVSGGGGGKEKRIKTPPVDVKKGGKSQHQMEDKVKSKLDHKQNSLDYLSYSSSNDKLNS